MDNPSIGAFAIVENKGMIILVRHTNGERKFSLPGGGLEVGETAAHTIHREVWEETGMHELSFRHIGTFFLRKSAGVVFLFHAKENSIMILDATKDAQEIADIILADPNDLPIDIYPAQRKLIERWRDDDLGNRGHWPFDLL